MQKALHGENLATTRMHHLGKVDTSAQHSLVLLYSRKQRISLKSRISFLNQHTCISRISLRATKN